MPEITLYYFKEDDDNIPLNDWLDTLPERDLDKSRQRLGWLEVMGQELRRPLADYLRDQIYELRIRVGNVHHRILYFFGGKGIAVASHGFSGKQGKVPDREIERARKTREVFMKNPGRHSFLKEQP